MYQQKIDSEEVSGLIEHFKYEAYDTETVLEDIPELQQKIGSDNSIAFKTKFNSDIYGYIQQYIYYQKSMKYFCVFVCTYTNSNSLAL